jgi:malate/lactate dehydrogenase
VRGARRAAPRFHAALRARALPARSLATAPRRLSRHAEGSTVVVIPAGVPRKPGMSRDDLFATNAGIVATLVDACAKYCPKVRGAPRRSGAQ